MQVQLINDEMGHTLCSAATFSKEFINTAYGKKGKESARKLGEEIAKIAKEKNVSEVVFDRGGRKYHGLLKELGEAAKNAGLQF